MGQYANETTVSVEKSRAEIETTVRKYGATGFLSGWDADRAYIAFEMKDRRLKFMLPLPDRKDKRFWYSAHRRRQRSPEDAYREWEQACRQRWRALALAIKAKLEAVETGIATFEEEFMAHIVLPSGQTVGEWMLPQIGEAYATGSMPPLLPLLPAPPAN